MEKCYKQNVISWIKLAMFNSILIFSTYGLYTRMHFSPDGYCRLLNGFSESLTIAGSGRYIALLEEYLLYVFKLEKYRSSAYGVLAFILMSGVLSASLTLNVAKLKKFQNLIYWLSILEYY